MIGTYGAASRTIGPESYQTRPTNWRAWIARYNWLDDWYHGVDYSPTDVALLRLFHAVSEDRANVLATTSRVTRDVQYVVDTDANILAGGRWSLQLARGDERSPLLTAGEAVWHRSHLQAQKGQWVRAACIHGDAWLEAIREAAPDGSIQTRIVAYDARHCRPFYAPDGVTLERLVVEIPHFVDDDVEVLAVYRREIDATGIRVTDLSPAGDRVEVAGQTGAHGLGVPPVVHLRHQPIPGYPEHSLWAGAGLDRPMQAIDSLYAQLRAIANRYAHPHMVFTGVRPDPGEFEAFGRAYWLNNPDAKVAYLEAGMAALQPINEIMGRYNDEIRATMPEFIMAGVGANTSGRALEMRADALKRKMREIGGRHSEAISRVTEYAVLMGQNAAYDPSTQVYRVMFPPILPIDEPTTIRLANESVVARTLKRVDAVRLFQRVGLIDEEIDAPAYAAELDAMPTAAPVDTGAEP